MAEWLKAHAWKACLGVTVTWVRIPLSPPCSQECRETRLQFLQNHSNYPEFRDLAHKPDWEKVSHFPPQASFAALFSEGPLGSPVSRRAIGECNAITTRGFGDSGLTFQLLLCASCVPDRVRVISSGKAPF